MSLQLISQHLDAANLKYKTYPVNTICAFTGEQITTGVKLADLVSDVFTDWEYVKHPSGYVSVDTALCIADVVPGKTRNNSLRNYSYMANNKSLLFLNRQDVLQVIMNIAETPFRIAVSYNNKKHTSYKTIENVRPDEFVITTDLYNVVFIKSHIEQFLSVIQNWYSVISAKASTAAQPTYFTKDEILHGNAPYSKQLLYGIEKFEEENEMLKPYRNTHIFELIVHLLNKALC